MANIYDDDISSPPASTTCAGQTVTGGSDCNSMSTKYGVTTGDLQVATNSSTCQVTSSICLPAACALQQVASGQTCSYALPPPPLGTSADAGNQQRGREGGVVAPTTTVSSTITHPASQGSGSAPSPTQDGLASNCNNFASVKGGDTCFDRAKAYGITPEQLYAYHARHRPGPTQSGIDPNCNKYAPAQKGDVCDTFAARSSISNAQLYAWNAALGSSGQNCGSSLWADEWYCVGISAPAAGSTASSSKITRVTAPGPT
ncbi:Peptidoglycan-binding Lysin subgroup [Apiospora saccharicola]